MDRQAKRTALQAAASDKKLQQLMDLTGYTHSKLDSANRKLGKTNRELGKTNQKLDETTSKLGKTNRELGKANRKLDIVIDQRETAKDRRVMDLNTDSEHHLLLFRTNCDDDDDVHYRNYATIRAQEKSVKQAIRILMKKYPDAELILELVNVPNAMRIWNTYRSDHKHHLVNFNTSRTSFDLARGYTEAMLVRDLKHTYQKRMDTNELFSDDESE
jgi:chromosome segregation ATPase